MSQFYGAKDAASLRQIRRLVYEFAIALAFLGMLLIFVFRGKIGLLFGSSADVNAGIRKIMPIFLLSLPFDAITRISTAGFYATEKNTLSYLLTFLEPVLMLGLMLLLPPLFGGQTMIWWSTVLAKVMTACVGIFLSVRKTSFSL